ncbi:hypothetical protein A0H81_14063 [Grifola frondosa]|uniref:Uncharacterized protein n=1 Tax=Grifola frondosa TaxID=5627 RepID=A0A1C7LNY6_GRIFR|nr:hypothetical protein A0H81_14063 [Grifola frondosa]
MPFSGLSILSLRLLSTFVLLDTARFALLSCLCPGIVFGRPQIPAAYDDRTIDPLQIKPIALDSARSSLWIHGRRIELFLRPFLARICPSLDLFVAKQINSCNVPFPALYSIQGGAASLGVSDFFLIDAVSRLVILHDADEIVTPVDQAQLLLVLKYANNCLAASQLCNVRSLKPRSDPAAIILGRKIDAFTDMAFFILWTLIPAAFLIWRAGTPMGRPSPRA